MVAAPEAAETTPPAAEPPTGRRPGLSPRLAWTVAGLFALCLFGQAYLAGLRHSLTWDEPSYIGAGVRQLRHGDFRLNPSHPPLMQQLAALPLLLDGIREPRQEMDHFLARQNPAVAYGRALLFGSENNPLSAAALARLPVSLLAGMMVLLAFAWGRRILGGDAPALIGCAALALSPNLVAHAGLATEDLGCAALCLAGMASLWWALRRPSATRWLLCGALSGLCLGAKYTGLLLGPMQLLALVGWLVLRRRAGEDLALWPTLRLAPLYGLGLYAVLLLLYRGDPTLAPYFTGLGQIYGDKADAPYAFYLLGDFSPEPYWYYYLVALPLKLPLPTLALIAWAMVVAAARRDQSDARAALFLLLPAALVLLVTCFDRANLGLRRVLPALPFLLLFCGSVAARRADASRLRRLLPLALLAGLALEAVTIYPHHLSYFSSAAGGPENGPNLLDDSNIDWGQDLPALARWQQEHAAGQPLALHYFGTAPPAAYGVESRPFPRSRRALLAPQPGVYALSVQILIHLRGAAGAGGGFGSALSWLDRFTPVGRAGHSIYIYRFK